MYKPVINNHTRRDVTGHNSGFNGLAQRESVTPEMKRLQNILTIVELMTDKDGTITRL